VACSGEHGHVRPPQAQLTETQRQQALEVIRARPQATATDLVYGTNNNPLSPVTHGGGLHQISPMLTNIDFINGLRRVANPSTQTLQSVQQWAVDHNNFIFSCSFVDTIWSPRFIFIHSARMRAQFERQVVNRDCSFLCDMSFGQIPGYNMITMSAFNQDIAREVPLFHMFIAGESRFVYCWFFLHVFTCEQGLVNLRTGALNFPGLTVDFSDAQRVGLQLAVGMLRIMHDDQMLALPPFSTLDRHEERARRLGERAIEQLRGCRFHFTDSWQRMAGYLEGTPERQRAFNRHVGLWTSAASDVTAERVFDSMAQCPEEFAEFSTWLQYWSRREVAQMAFPALSQLTIEQWNALRSTTCGLERLHRLINERIGRAQGVTAVLGALQAIDEMVLVEEQAVRAGHSVRYRVTSPGIASQPSRRLSQREQQGERASEVIGRLNRNARTIRSQVPRTAAEDRRAAALREFRAQLSRHLARGSRNEVGAELRRRYLFILRYILNAWLTARHAAIAFPPHMSPEMQGVRIVVEAMLTSLRTICNHNNGVFTAALTWERALTNGLIGEIDRQAGRRGELRTNQLDLIRQCVVVNDPPLGRDDMIEGATVEASDTPVREAIVIESSSESSSSESDEEANLSDFMQALCLICDERVVDAAMRHVEFTLTPCRHMYHADCLDDWLRRGESICPICAGPLPPLRDEMYTTRSRAAWLGWELHRISGDMAVEQSGAESDSEDSDSESTTASCSTATYRARSRSSSPAAWNPYQVVQASMQATSATTSASTAPAMRPSSAATTASSTAPAMRPHSATTTASSTAPAMRPSSATTTASAAIGVTPVLAQDYADCGLYSTYFAYCLSTNNISGLTDRAAYNAFLTRLGRMLRGGIRRSWMANSMTADDVERLLELLELENLVIQWPSELIHATIGEMRALAREMQGVLPLVSLQMRHAAHRLLRGERVILLVHTGGHFLVISVEFEGQLRVSVMDSAMSNGTRNPYQALCLVFAQYFAESMAEQLSAPVEIVIDSGEEEEQQEVDQPTAYSAMAPIELYSGETTEIVSDTIEERDEPMQALAPIGLELHSGEAAEEAHLESANPSLLDENETTTATHALQQLSAATLVTAMDNNVPAWEGPEPTALDSVLILWDDGLWHQATVVKRNSDGTYRVRFLSDNTVVASLDFHPQTWQQQASRTRRQRRRASGESTSI
jgi:hypothetical protein